MLAGMWDTGSQASRHVLESDSKVGLLTVGPKTRICEFEYIILGSCLYAGFTGKTILSVPFVESHLDDYVIQQPPLSFQVCLSIFP